MTPDRRRHQVLLAGHRPGPLVYMRWTPPPRELVGERYEPANQPFPRRDRDLLQPACRLLCPPALLHRLDHGLLGPQLDHAGDELQVRTPARSPRPTPASYAEQPSGGSGGVLRTRRPVVGGLTVTPWYRPAEAHMRPADAGGGRAAVDAMVTCPANHIYSTCDSYSMRRWQDYRPAWFAAGRSWLNRPGRPHPRRSHS